MSVFEKVKSAIVNNLSVDPDKITLDTNLKNDLHADSIDAVQVIMDLEDEFGIEIDVDKIQDNATVGTIVELIEASMIIFKTSLFFAMQFLICGIVFDKILDMQ